MRHRHLLASLALSAGLILGSQAQAQEPPLPPGAPANYPVKPGPYAITIESDASLPHHTIYRPTDLKAVSKGALPIVVWGNGGCSNAGKGFEKFLTTVASHGYIIIVAGDIDAPLPNWGPPKPGEKPAAPQMTGPMTKAKDLVDAIDWAVAQGNTASSPYAGKLDTTNIAVMGQSCGGLMALEVSADPRIKTSMIFDSGTFPPRPGAPAISSMTAADLVKIHAPIAYIIGGPTDIAYQNAENDFKALPAVPAFKGNLNVGHPGTFFQPGGGWFAEVASQWLGWQLKGDQTAKKMFVGADCALCTNKDWVIERKNFDAL